MSIQDQVAAVFDGVGIPASIWKPIESVESGGDPYVRSHTANEDSIGLFQLNKEGGLGAGHSDAELYDPVKNATIAANAMKPSYLAGLAKGLSGFSLTQYVAYNSGWPTSAGVGALQTDQTVKNYDTKLQKAYSSPDVSMTTGLAKSISDALPSSSGGYGYYIVLGGLALVGVLFFTRVFANKGV